MLFRSKAEEFIGRVMMPVLLLTSNKQNLEGSAGAKSDRATVNNPNLKYQVSLATPPEVSVFVVVVDMLT